MISLRKVAFQSVFILFHRPITKQAKPAHGNLAELDASVY